MKYPIYSLIIFLFLFVYSCDQRSEYERMVERELESGVRNDSLFLGYYLGMEDEDFFDHSWELNQQNVITGDSRIRYKLQKLSNDATMTFYPSFKNGRINRMPVEIQFDAWAIWNRELYSDSLIVELVDYYEEIYGSGFIHTVHPELEKESWIKVDGNRRISVYQKDDMRAHIEFLDLTAE